MTLGVDATAALLVTGELVEVFEVIPPAVEATLNKEVDEGNLVPLELEAGVAAVVEVALNVKVDKAIVVPFEPPLLQPGA